MTTENRSSKIRTMCLTAMFMAVEFAMWTMGLGQVPVGPLNMSFLTVPVALGAMLLGIPAGTILGAAFGLTSFLDAMSGKSVLTGFFFSVSPLKTFLLCVVMRTLMGALTGLFFSALRRTSRRAWTWYAGALAAPLLNTCLFMGFIVLAFYQTEMVQGIVTRLGAANPFMFVVLLVGVQGLAEAAVCTLVSGTVAQGVARAMHIR